MAKVKDNVNVKLDLVLDAEQTTAKEMILAHNSEVPILVLVGRPGTGKTALAANIALSLLFKERIGSILMGRPAVTISSAVNEVGFLPGDLKAKLEKFVEPIKDALYENYSSSKEKTEKLDKLIDEGIIQLLSVGHIRGNNFGKKGHHQCVIIDEAQNVDPQTMLAILTRLKKGSLIILTGDLRQQDLRGESGLTRILKLSKSISQIKVVKLTKNYRDPIVNLIDDAWDEAKTADVDITDITR